MSMKVEHKLDMCDAAVTSSAAGASFLKELGRDRRPMWPSKDACREGVPFCRPDVLGTEPATHTQS